jgi:hypothetical protein
MFKSRVSGAIANAVRRAAPAPIAKARSVRPAGPMKRPIVNPLGEADQTLANTGDGLRRTIGRIGSRTRLASKGGKIRKGYKEGGKVETGMMALKALAKKVEEALASGDNALAKRLKRQMELMKRGSSQTDDNAAELEVAEEKVATFAKGGKVTGVIALVRKMKKLQNELDHAGTPGHKNEKMTNAEIDALIDRQEKIREQIKSKGVDPDDVINDDEGS